MMVEPIYITHPKNPEVRIRLPDVDAEILWITRAIHRARRGDQSPLLALLEGGIETTGGRECLAEILAPAKRGRGRPTEHTFTKAFANEVVAETKKLRLMGIHKNCHKHALTQVMAKYDRILAALDFPEEARLEAVLAMEQSVENQITRSKRPRPKRTRAK